MNNNETQTFQGAVKSHSSPYSSYSGESWALTNDTKLLSEADSDDILWVDNLATLRAELETRHPQPHPSLKVLSENVHSVSIDVLKYPQYEGENPEEIYALSKEFGRIQVLGGGHTRTKKWEEYTPIAKECRVWGQYFQKWVEYNPVLVKKKYKAKAERLAKAFVTCRELQDVANKTARHMWAHIELKGCSVTCSLHESMKKMTQHLAVFNMLFGKQAHRKWEPFQKLCLQWKSRAKNNGDRFKETPELEKFAEWMDKEAKKRLPPVCTEWTVVQMVVPI